MDNQSIFLENGFSSSKEFNKLISNVDLSSVEKIKQFKKWQGNDGTKKGLLKLQEIK